MNKFLKRLSCLVLAGTVCATAVACGTPNKNPVESEQTPNYTKDEYAFTTIATDGQKKTLDIYNPENPKANGCVEYSIYRNIGNKNYLKLEVETDSDLVGYINYKSVTDANKTNSEKFFIKAGSSEFTTFLDAFRKGAKGDYDKIITTVTFQNVDSTKQANFTFKSAGISDRSIDTYENLYISNGDTVLGTSPFYGGCITYLEKLEQDVYEYMDSDGNICIDRDVDPDYVYKVVSDKVNLVNIYDLGREIQPSYYAHVTKANGYDPDYDPEDKDSYYQGIGTGQPIYNPIQCGDFGGHTPQIIDYKYSSDYLYIKMKAQEWFFYTNIQANGYIECTYYFDDGGALMVDNVYTDFSQFTNVDQTPITTQETPATYFVYPLNYFYCETKQGVIFDKNTSEQNGINQGKVTLRSTVSSADYFYALNAKMVTDGWCAFVNENKFGVGIFLPNADGYIASRGRKSLSYFAEKCNSAYHPDFFTFGEDEIIPSYAAMNYSYINPALTRRMIDFVPLEYTYALYVGDTSEMKEVFKELDESGTLTNAHLKDKTKGWPQK